MLTSGKLHFCKFDLLVWLEKLNIKKNRSKFDAQSFGKQISIWKEFRPSIYRNELFWNLYFPLWAKRVER